MLDPGGGGVDPRAQIMQLLQAAAVGRQRGYQDYGDFNPNPAELPPMPPQEQMGSDARFLGPPIQQDGDPSGNPVAQFAGSWPGRGGGGPQFMGPPIHPPYDPAAAQRHRNKSQGPMDPQRAIAMQEMGKYLQAYGKLHQAHSSLMDAMHASQSPTSGRGQA